MKAVKRTKRRKTISALLAIVMVFSLMQIGLLRNTAGAADPSETWNLGNFIVPGVNGVIVKDKDGERIGENDVVFDGEKYTITVSFTERTGAYGQFEYNEELLDSETGEPIGYLVYTLPGNLKLLSDISNGEIRLSAANGNSLVGGYTATASNGVFKVWFGDFDQNGNPSPGKNFIDYTDARFTLEFDAKFNAGAGTVSLDFGANASINLIVKEPDPSISVSKSAAAITGDNKINYTIVIDAGGYAAAQPPQEIAHITISDALGMGSGYSTSLSDSSPTSSFSGFNYVITRASGGTSTKDPMSVTWDDDVIGSRYGFTYDFDDDDVVLNPGDKITVTYTVDLNKLLPANGFTREFDAFTLRNTVNASGSAGDDSSDINITIPGKTFVTKSVTPTITVTDTTTKPAWTVTVGNGYEALNTKTLTDTLSVSTDDYGTVEFPASDDIEVEFYASASSSTPDFTYSVEELSAITGCISFNPARTELTIVVPASTEPRPGFSPPANFSTINKVVIKYSTDNPELDPPAFGDTYSVTHTNTIDYNSLITKTQSVGFSRTNNITPPGPGVGTVATNKTTSGPRMNDGAYEVEYEIRVTIPGGNIGAGFYLRDELVIEQLAGGNISVGNPAPAITQVKLFDGSTDVTVSDDFASKYRLSASGSTWDMYFGTTPGTASAGNSYWPYNDERTIVITYTVPLSGDKAQIQTIIGARLRNTISVLDLSSVLIDTTGDRVTYDAWPIHKSVSPSAADPSVFDYTITLNRNELYQLFDSGKEAVILDEFNSKLKFVPGSFYVQDKTASPNVYYGLGDDTAIVAGNTLEIDLNELLQYDDWASSSALSTPDPDWYTGNHWLEIHYRLRMPDPANEDSAVLYNTATLKSTSFDFEFANFASAGFVNNPVVKFLTTDGSKDAQAEIIINPNGWKLLPAGVSVYEAIDTMSPNLTFVRGSIKVYTQTKAPDGSWPGVWIDAPVVFSNDHTAWTWNSGGPQEISFFFPDGTPIKIEYDVLVTTLPGVKEDIWNKINVEGRIVTASEGNYEVSGTIASADASKKELYVIKQDDNHSVTLGGAEFELYMATRSNDYYGSDSGDGVKTITIGDKVFYFIMKETTGEDGTAYFDTNWLSPSHEAVFLLAETVAPTGYTLPSAPNNYTLFVIHSTDTEQLGIDLGIPVSYIGDTVYVDNTKTPVTPPPGTTKPPPDDTPDDTPPTRPPSRPPTGGEDDGGDDSPPGERDIIPPYVPGGSDPNQPPNPSVEGHELVLDGDGWLEFDDMGVPLGRWGWDDDLEEWIFDMFPPLGDFPPSDMPKTGIRSSLDLWIYGLLASLSALGIVCLDLTYMGKRLRKTAEWRYMRSTRWITRR